MGHGGTLDPLATGVLIVGIGRGTKYLNTFLGCTKTYETTVLFGKSTDTYDVAGKIVAEKPTSHITKVLVEQNLEKFRGEIKQVPPIYSALKIQGIKAYEYARSGKELPRELESRDMVVTECTMMEWYDQGQHDFRWPAESAAEEDRSAAQKLMQGAENTSRHVDDNTSMTAERRETSSAAASKTETMSSGMKAGSEPTSAMKAAKEVPASPHKPSPRPQSYAETVALHTHNLPTQSSQPADAPAATFRLTVSSGFYVRSFAHDLGIACNSYALMSTLQRSRQGNFTVLDPPPAPSMENEQPLMTALTMKDLKDEKVWGPKIRVMLERWMKEDAETKEREGPHPDDRDLPEGFKTRDRRREKFKNMGRSQQGPPERKGGRRGQGNRRDKEYNDGAKRARNSSSEGED